MKTRAQSYIARPDPRGLFSLRTLYNFMRTSGLARLTSLVCVALAGGRVTEILTPLSIRRAGVVSGDFLNHGKANSRSAAGDGVALFPAQAGHVPSIPTGGEPLLQRQPRSPSWLPRLGWGSVAFPCSRCNSPPAAACTAPRLQRAAGIDPGMLRTDEHLVPVSSAWQGSVAGLPRRHALARDK